MQPSRHPVPGTTRRAGCSTRWSIAVPGSSRNRWTLPTSSTRSASPAGTACSFPSRAAATPHPGYAVCDDGLLIDLSRMRHITVDPEARVASAEGGATWGEFDAATQRHGLAVTGGRIRGHRDRRPHAGQRLGVARAEARLHRRQPARRRMSCCASGDVRAGERAASTRTSSGACAAAAATSAWSRVSSTGSTRSGRSSGAACCCSPATGGKRRCSRLTATSWRQRQTTWAVRAALVTMPPLPMIPAAAQGRPRLAIVALLLRAARGGRAARSSRSCGCGPAAALAQPMPYLDVQGLLEEANPPGKRNYWKADMYPDLPDEAIDALLAATARPRLAAHDRPRPADRRGGRARGGRRDGDGLAAGQVVAARARHVGGPGRRTPTRWPGCATWPVRCHRGRRRRAT